MLVIIQNFFNLPEILLVLYSRLNLVLFLLFIEINFFLFGTLSEYFKAFCLFSWTIPLFHIQCIYWCNKIWIYYSNNFLHSLTTSHEMKSNPPCLIFPKDMIVTIMLVVRIKVSVCAIRTSKSYSYHYCFCYYTLLYQFCICDSPKIQNAAAFSCGVLESVFWMEFWSTNMSPLWPREGHFCSLSCKLWASPVKVANAPWMVRFDNKIKRHGEGKILLLSP